MWDGFVDEAGKYTTYGPDYEGQMRRLRSGDGVYFTKSGARKLAHYVEREMRRYMSNRGPVALPSGPVGPVPAEAKSTVRPVAGPVVPLTVTPGNSDELLGGASASAGAWRRHRQPRAGQGRAGAGAARTRRRFRLAAGQRRARCRAGRGVPRRPQRLRPSRGAGGQGGRPHRTDRGGQAARSSLSTRAAAKTSQTTGVKPRVEHRVETKPRPPQPTFRARRASIPQSRSAGSR